MYLFISKNEVIPYNGEVLKRYIGKKLVKIIANPTDEDLKEFGYMGLVEGLIPEYEEEKQYLTNEYEVIDDKIYLNYKVEDIIVEDIVDEDIVEETENSI